MKTIKKWCLKWILDAFISNPPPLIIILVCVFGSVFSIGFWCAHWIDEISLTSYRIYDVMSDNIAEKSYMNILRDLLPVDVVYTWVNGSDPLLLENLQKLSEADKFICNYANCFPSPYFATEIKVKQAPFRNTSYLEYLQRSEIHKGNTSKFFDIVVQKDVISDFTSKLNASNFTQAYWTSDIKVEWSLPWKRAVIIRLETAGNVHFEIKKVASHEYEDILKKCKISSHYKTFVVDCPEEVLAETLRQKLENFKNEHQMEYPKVWKANLIFHSELKSKDFDINRFKDNEELRYSLRSLEKFAPWVRRIFLVTNGQIPYWLNLDHPRIRIVTHDEIFTDKSHLPTFSSPAIEAHIHRIPGLSQNFLYLNDDIMLGKPVWPEDFSSPSSGYKIYLAWSLPECSSGCPGSWINDGYCDRACNTSACHWDGGDCASSPGDPSDDAFDLDSDEDSFVDPIPFCSTSCSDSWLADSYCDAACNTLSCGFDAGDCGLEVVKENMVQLPYEISYSRNISLVVPQGQLAAWINILPWTKTVKNATLKGKYSGLKGVRLVSANTVLGAVIFIMKTNFTGIIDVQLELSAGEKLKQELHFAVHFDTRPLSPKLGHWEEHLTFNDSKEMINYSFERRFPQILKTNIFDDKTAESLKHPINKGMNNTEIIKQIRSLHDRYVNGELTEKGFKIMKHFLLTNKTLHSSLNLTYLDHLQYSGTANLTSSNRLKTRKILSANPNKYLSYDGTLGSFPGFLPWERNSDGILNSPEALESDIKPRTGRKLLDTFGESLLFVNRLYNTEYGFQARKVVAHMPHFINKKILEELHYKFSHEFHVTSSHKVRQGNDMQFAFSYFYFLMSERRQMTQEELFDQFDTDLSGTWSDREIRTLLTQTEDLPLRYPSFVEFNNAIKNCSKKINPKPVSTPVYERYADSDVPTVSKELVMNCDEKLVQEKLKKLKDVPRFRHIQLSDSEVHFKMISSNISSVVYHLDEIRKSPRKFICINSNLDPTSGDNDLVHAVVQDTYESLYPIPSSFELLSIYRNRFSYSWQLEEWKRWKNLIKSLIYAFLSCLILLTVTAFFGTEIEAMKRKWCRRRRKKNDLLLARV